MKKIMLFIIIVFIASIDIAKAENRLNNADNNLEVIKDSTRLIELDKFWIELSRTVREGDFKGYKATYHEDAVVIFATGKNKRSISITSALAGWEKDFVATKSGKVKSDVKFRFSQRIGDETTAHETGIFHYTSTDSQGNELSNSFIHFEMLLVKRNGKWYGVMEYQKSKATKEEWEAL